MPAKKNENEQDETFISTPATPAVDQLAEIDAQIKALTAQKKAARLAEQQRKAQEREAKKAASVLTLEQVIEKQNGHYQEWVVETLAGRVMTRTKAGQEQQEALREVFAQMETWTLEEIQRRQSSK